MKNKITEKVEKKIEEGFNIDTTPDALPIIKDLVNTDFSKGKRAQMEACKRMMHLANSNENISNVFFRGINRAAKQIGEVIIKKCDEGHFKIKKFRV